MNSFESHDQNFQLKNQEIQQIYIRQRASEPDGVTPKLKLSWSNWGFGIESLSVSAKRLAKAGIPYIELHGNRYGNDLGYDTAEVRAILDEHGLKVSGICGMFSADCDLSSNRGVIRQNAIDYIRRNVDLGHQLGAQYFLIVPGAVGRPRKIDNQEFFRSVETLARVADIFTQAGIKGAIEPIRSAEVSFCHTIDDALKYIDALSHPGVQHINGDVYHMQAEEAHIGEAILRAGHRLCNLHLADSNRCALGDGSLDLDTIIMALYAVGYHLNDCFCTPEPLGPGGDPYPAMFGAVDPAMLDALVNKTADYFRQREEQVRTTRIGHE